MRGKGKSVPEEKNLQGFEAQHYAYRLNDIYFSPAQFAMAWLAVRTESEIEEILNKEVDKILDGTYDREDTPYFFDLVQVKDADKERFSIKDLDDLAFKVYKTHKFIKKPLILSVNKEGNKGTISDKHTVSIEVDSRKRRTAKTPSIDVTLRNPFIGKNEKEGYNLDDLDNFSFNSPGPYMTKNMSKLNPFSEGVQREKGFVDGLAKLVSQHFKGADYKITETDVMNDFTRSIFIMDAYGSRALSFLDKENKSKIGSIKGLEKINEEVIMPFDFDKNPRYVFETFLQLHLKPKSRNKEKNMQKRYFKMDKYLFEKDITSDMFKQAFKKQKVTKEVFVRNKNWSENKLYWSVIMALTEHFYKEKRRFAGFTFEFEGTPYETVAMAFKNAQKTRKNFTTRILYDTNIPAYPMYKETDKPGKKKIDKNPLEFVNYAVDRKTKDADRKERKAWQEIDGKTGRHVISSIFEIKEPVLNRAAEILRTNGVKFDGKYLTPFDLRGLLYIKPLQDYKSVK